MNSTTSSSRGIDDVGREKRREKVVVLRELQRGIIYTRELSKPAIEGHVSTALIVYSVYEGARLTDENGDISLSHFSIFYPPL
jgi:hypothetical protein